MRDENKQSQIELYNCGNKVLTMKLIKVDKLKTYIYVTSKEKGTCFLIVCGAILLLFAKQNHFFILFSKLILLQKGEGN